MRKFENFVHISPGAVFFLQKKVSESYYMKNISYGCASQSARELLQKYQIDLLILFMIKNSNFDIMNKQ
jgi:hypothetical protein